MNGVVEEQFEAAYDEGFDSGYRGLARALINPFRSGEPGADADFAYAWDVGWVDGNAERAKEIAAEKEGGGS